MKHYNKTRNIKRKLKHMTRRIKKGRTSRLLFKSKVLGKQLRKLSKKFIQRGGLQQRGGATYTIKKEDYIEKLRQNLMDDDLVMKISTTSFGGKTKVWDDKTKKALNNISFNPTELNLDSIVHRPVSAIHTSTASNGPGPDSGSGEEAPGPDSGSGDGGEETAAAP